VERLPVMGLFIHEEFMKDLLAHFAFAKPQEIVYASFLQPRLSIEDARSSIKRMENLISLGKTENESLIKVKDELDFTLEKFRKEIDRVVEETRKKYHDKIEAIRPDVTEKVAQLEKKREEMWSSMQPRLLALKSEVKKLESEEDHWQQESKRKDVGPEAASKARERLKHTRDSLKGANIEVVKYQEEMAQVRAGYDKQIQTQWERIRTLERERDEELKRLLDSQRTMVSRAGQISQDIEGLKKRKEKEIAFMESQGVQIPPQLETNMVNIPLMISLLHGEKRMRYIIYPPMIAKTGKGMIGGLQSMLGGLVLPLEPKTRHFDEVFKTGIENALSEDSSLATYIRSISMSANILHREDLPSMLVKGFADMKRQGWIKDKHEKELLQSLQKHITYAAASAPPKE